MNIFQRHIFPTHYRVRHSWEYKKIQQAGRKIKLKNFTVLYQVREEGPVRLGLIVSRKVGGSVQRNRVKRLVREFFRQNKEQLPGHWDLVIIAKRGAHKLSYLSVFDELTHLFNCDPVSSEGRLCLENR